MTGDETRPRQESVETREEFERWYWPVESLHAFCDRLEISKAGRKDELRQRIASVLAGEAPPASKPRARAKENWGKKTLTLETVITEQISFGPNVRRFFKTQIGKRFVCHSDFMSWVRNNPGATLADAVQAWESLEARKNDPTFRREIARCNNFLRYLRDIRDAHPEMTLGDAKACWDSKKIRPATGGYVRYEPSDLRCLTRP